MSIRFDSEASLEDGIEREIEKTGICPVSGEDVHSLIRQLKIPGYGRCDLVKVGLYRSGAIVTVMELKNEPLQPQDLNQVCRYMTGLRRALYRFSFFQEWVEVRGQLVGPLGSTDYVWLFQECGIGVFSFDIDFNDGVVFSEIDGWMNRGENPQKMNSHVVHEITRMREHFQEMEPRLTSVKGGKSA